MSTVNIALPKGRLATKTLELLSRIGFDTAEVTKDNRKLVFENVEDGVKYFLVKPSDVAIYVERGVADIGVVGKDILLENRADVYELLDLGIGRCRVCVAACNDFFDDTTRPLRVATKFTNIATDYYAAESRDIELIKLSGSIELAPIVGLADVIVDLVETGNTIRENDMRIVTEIMPISARLIAGKSAYKFKGDRIDRIVARLAEVVK